VRWDFGKEPLIANTHSGKDPYGSADVPLVVDVARHLVVLIGL
jgi:hypothetical protein